MCLAWNQKPYYVWARLLTAHHANAFIPPHTRHHAPFAVVSGLLVLSPRPLSVFVWASLYALPRSAAPGRHECPHSQQAAAFLTLPPFLMTRLANVPAAFRHSLFEYAAACRKQPNSHQMHLHLQQTNTDDLMTLPPPPFVCPTLSQSNCSSPHPSPPHPFQLCCACFAALPSLNLLRALSSLHSLHSVETFQVRLECNPPVIFTCV
jgi:hypothetical protein